MHVCTIFKSLYGMGVEVSGCLNKWVFLRRSVCLPRVTTWIGPCTQTESAELAGCLSGAGLVIILTACLSIYGRGLHSSTSQLNLSRVRHTKTPYTPRTPINALLTRAKQSLTYTPYPTKSAEVELRSERVEAPDLRRHRLPAR